MSWNTTLPAHDDPMVGYALNRIERQYGHEVIKVLEERKVI